MPASGTHTPLPAAILEEHDIRTHFKQQLRKHSVKAVCSREYVRTNALRAWMLASSPIGNGARNVDFLLEACWQKDHTGFPAPATSIINGPRSCLDVFAVLLEIDRGHLVERFQEFGITDDKLPMDLATLANTVERANLDQEVAYEFNRAQWKYKPLIFHMDDWRNEPGNRIIPICEKDIIKKGGTAKVYRVLVQEDFVSPELKDAISSSFYEDSLYGRCYIMVLKTYKKHNKHLYDNEIHAFRGLRENAGMIKCLLTYSHLELESHDDGNETWTTKAVGEITHNIVLVKGEYDLQAYFEYLSPPAMVEEVFGFWSAVFLLARAVKDIHDFETQSANFTESYHGYHADIKPENILMVGEEFKLADPGFARFQSQTDVSWDQRGHFDFWGGTTTFGAPECHLANRSNAAWEPSAKITPAIDIWSLGCVFSVAATWIVLNQQGVEQFAALRQRGILGAQGIHEAPPDIPNGTEIGQDDYFHDGRMALPEISEWHDVLRSSIRRCDAITDKVLKLVENHMLLENAGDRISAASLTRELDEIQRQQAKIKPSTESTVIKSVIGNQESIYGRDMREQSRKEDQLKRDLDKAEQNLTRIESNQHGLTVETSNEFITAALQGVRSAQENITTKQVIRPNSNSLTGPHNQRISNLYTSSKRTTHRSKVVMSTADATVGHASLLHQVPEHEPSSHVVRSKTHDDTQGLHQASLPTYDRSRTSSHQRNRSQTTSLMMIGNDTNNGSILRRFNSLVTRAKSKITPKKPDERLQRFYHHRDIAFVVDNANTMLPFWNDARKLLVDLASLAQHVDKDGMDLKFTCGETRFNPTNEIAAFGKAMDKTYHQPLVDVTTDMSEVLGQLLAQYLNDFGRAEKFRTGSNNTKKLTIIVLTDGLWQRMDNEIAVDNQIVLFSQELKKLRGPLEERDRRVSVQFVQFGTDQGASHRLWRLDNQLIYRGVADIVDTRPWDADLYKILLGSLDKTIDDDDKPYAQSPEIQTPIISSVLGSVIDREQTTSPEQLLLSTVDTAGPNSNSTNSA